MWYNASVKRCFMELMILGLIVVLVFAVAMYFVVKALQSGDNETASPKNKNAKFLNENSEAISALLCLNEKYKNKLYCDSIYNVAHTYDNADYFEDISCEDYLIYMLQERKNEILQKMKIVEFCKRNYTSYINDVKKIDSFGKFKSPIDGYDSDELLNAKKEVFEDETFESPEDFEVEIILYYAKMNDEIVDYKKQTFGKTEVIDLIDRLNDRNGYYYNDRGIWDSLCRVERGKVSNKLRFEIFERDGYKCRYCGRGEDERSLQIDHIKPISKGGKSTYDNLQTLCEDCNKQKDNKYF